MHSLNFGRIHPIRASIRLIRFVPAYLSGWWFGTFFTFAYIGNFIILTDELHDFSEGLAATTNQL